MLFLHLEPLTRVFHHHNHHHHHHHHHRRRRRRRGRRRRRLRGRRQHCQFHNHHLLKCKCYAECNKQL